MQVMPVSPVAIVSNQKRPHTAHGAPLATRKARPVIVRIGASVTLELYGTPGKFGMFERYGNFSEKV